MKTNYAAIVLRIFSLLTLLLLLGAPQISRANLSFSLELFQDNNADVETQFYFAYCYLESTETPITSHHVVSPDGQVSVGLSSSNTLFEFNGGSYGDLNSMIEALTNGVWTLVLNTNHPSQETYTFTVSIDGLDNDSYSLVTIISPENNETAVDPHPIYEWIGPTNFSRGDVYLFDEDFGTFYFGDSFDPSETIWEPVEATPAGTNNFEVNYVLTNSSAVSFSTPMDGSSQSLAGWEASAQLRSYSSHRFVVSSSGEPEGHTLQAHYTFDNEFNRGEDTSGNGYNITGSGSGGGGSVTYTNDAAAGDGAARFNNNGGAGLAYLAPPTNIFPALSGSFTVSVWLKTTNTFGNNSDPGWIGAGIVHPVQFNQGNDSVPIAITGSKATFYTDHPSAPENNLRSLSSVNTGNYVYVAVTRDQSTGEKKIYINGALEASSLGTTVPLNEIEEMFDLHIGRGNKAFNGLLDDLQIYSGVLSAGEVEFLFDNPGESVPNVISSPLSEAVDAPEFIWTTGGNANWFGQTETTHDDIDAAQSGAIGDNADSWIETTVTGPGTVSFWWNVSSDDFDSFDYLEFDVDGNYETDIWGEWGWDFYTFEVGPGDHTLRWTYFKDSEFSAGDDAGYLDEFTFTPGPQLTITTQPFSQTNSPGYRAALFAEATGTPAPTWQWYKVGVGAISGATNALYIPTNSGTAAVAGNYYAIATSGLDTEQTTIATITFASAALPPDWTRAFKTPSDNNNLPISEAYLACRLDASGNLYSAGSFSGTNTIDGQTFVAANNKFQTFIVKQTPTGNVLWATAISSSNGFGNSFPQTIAPAPGDGIYVYGVFTGTNQFGTNVLVNQIGSSIYLARLDANGNVLWVRTAGGNNSNFTSFHQMIAEPSGNVTVSALLQGFVDFGTTNFFVSGGQKGYLIQYDADGNLRWLQQSSGWLQYLTYDSGRIYGSMGGNQTNFVGGLTNISDRRWILAALNPADGQANWLRPFASERTQGNPNGVGDDTPTIAVSGTNVFVIGSGWGFEAEFGPFSVLWSEPKGQYFARYDTNGTAHVALAFGSATTTPFASVADSNGNVYVGGDFDTYSIFGNNLLAAQPQENIGVGTFSHGFVAKFDRNGNPLWARLAESQSGLLNVRDISLASDGIWAGGFFRTVGTFGTNTVFSSDTCIGTPFCTPVYHRSGVLAKITDAVATALPTTIFNTSHDGNNFSFQFLSQSGFTHFIESRADVANGTWIQRTNLSGDGSTKIIQLPATNLSTDFFRIRTQ